MSQLYPTRLQINFWILLEWLSDETPTVRGVTVGWYSFLGAGIHSN